jgi:EAL domain-containing protein (putative c-di-GMP-specific phosphodiesterase class I)
LARHALAPTDLELEVTESVAMHNTEATIDLLDRLRRMGVTLALDDFGTGYSSLSYLKLLPIDRLKLDRSFVIDIQSNQDDAAICAATIAMAHKLSLKVVAEGVENDAQLAYLAQFGVDFVQGYFLSRPLPATEMEAFLRTQLAMASA